VNSPLRWRVGDVTITRIVESGGAGSPLFASVPPTFLFSNLSAEDVQSQAWLKPHFATADGRLIASIHAFVVESRAKTIVVDTCVGNDKLRALPAWTRLSGPFLDDFAAAGFALDRVDAVLCTHLHSDHVGWNTRRADGRWVPTFPRARYLLSRVDYDGLAAAADDNSRQVLADSVAPVLDAGLVDWVDSSHAITDEVRLEPTPGHTRGHVSVRIRSARAEAVITGDLMHHPIQCCDPRVESRFNADSEQAFATRMRFLREQADRDVLVLGTHFAAPTGGRIVSSGDAWRFDVPQAQDAPSATS
jgi:glyoxylase-like metal-dependent hydrolase (beta-lactamase superfamily II)